MEFKIESMPGWTWQRLYKSNERLYDGALRQQRGQTPIPD